MALAFAAHVALASDQFTWRLPPWITPPPVPADNPMTESKVELGRRLFFDIRLSGPGYMSCATCHEPKRGFSDGRRLPIGITGERHHRNAMTLANVGFFSTLTWADPKQTLLEDQLMRPLFGTRPIEMGALGHERPILDHIESNSVYRSLFARAFPASRGRIDFSNIAKAIAAFQRTLISATSPYDRYYFNGERTALSAAEKRGEKLFFGKRMKCGVCHTRPHFTDAAVEPRYHNTGLYNVDGQGALPGNDQGLADKTGRTQDVGKFRTPSLRNIAVSAPYMHDGSITSLAAVVDHYAAGGRAAQQGKPPPQRSALVSGFALSRDERRDLIAFLQTLTDHEFLNNPRFASPYR